MRSTIFKLNGGVAAAVVLVLSGSSALAQAQQKELSDKSVQTIMNYAWSILPAKFTAPNGKTIEVDKKKNDALVPIEVGRDVVKAGYISAQAQLCEMWEEQTANYDALMARERSKAKWTDQQLLYITTLHRMTIHMAAGKVKITEKGADELLVSLEPIEPSKDTCNAEKKKQVSERVAAYVKDAPKIAAAPSGQQPTSTQSIPAKAEKK